jgi:hypothetical protein
MTIKRNAAADHRIRPIREHIYTLPVVRELPAQPPDAAGAQLLW